MAAPVHDLPWDGAESEWMRRALHDLSQPLTALECCLFLGSMEANHASPQVELRLLRETVDESLLQCRRVIDHVRALNERLALAQEATAPRRDPPP